MSLEKNSLRIGYLPLLDCAPLIVAAEKGFFAQRGLEVELVPHGSWASLRDRLATGGVDAAHLLAPIVLASRMNLDGLNTPLVTALSLNRNGNTVTVSNALFEAVQAAGDISDAARAGAALAEVVRARATRGKTRLAFAYVHPHSSHHLLLRQWLAGAGLDPDKDVRCFVIPPAQMEVHVQAGNVDGFCAGAPWGALAESHGSARTLVTSAQIWPNHPEKVLGVTEAWARAHPQTHTQMLAALLEAARWLELSANRDELVNLMLRVLPAPVTTEVLHKILSTRPQSGGPVFFDGNATWPDRAHAETLTKRLRRALHLADDNAALTRAVEGYWPDLYQDAMRATALVT